MTRHVTTARYWRDLDAQRERMAAARRRALRQGEIAERQMQRIATVRDLDHVPHTATDAEIQAIAERRAQTMCRVLEAAPVDAMPQAGLAWLNAALHGLQCTPFRFVADRPQDRQLAGFHRRARAPEWWRRQLRRAVVREAETVAIGAGCVSAKARQWYASDATVRRRQQQNRRNAAILAATELENDEGQVFSLKALAEKGTGNKAVRRGELMTRIRGCEEWAEFNAHRGLFLTLTVPSRYHSTRFAGGPNPHHDGSTPREAQAWLCKTWGRVRARLQRAGIELYGFRVAEPHHDGCPHWHALLWVASDRDALLLLSTLWAYWLDDDGDEPGAAEHRVKAVKMKSGHAAGYCAKYIAKNIDDAGSVLAEGHRDEWAGADDGLQRELWANPAQRVEAWAAAWGIRQFQALGQPPVTVWREQRRVSAQAADAAPPRVAMAWDGVHRDGEKRACWHTYMDMQGGPNKGRDYLIRIAGEAVEHIGRYETLEISKPIGVHEAGSPDVVVPSTRAQWRPRGTWGQGEQRAPTAPRVAQRRAPWTRFNNCTHAERGEFRAIVAELLGRIDKSNLNGGVHTLEPQHEPPEPDFGRRRPGLRGIDRHW